jgi:Flp pilus assembly pilin Flp
MKMKLNLIRKQRGVTTLEYIVLGAVLVLGLVAGISAFKGKVSDSLDKEGKTLSDVAAGQTSGAKNYDK